MFRISWVNLLNKKFFFQALKVLFFFLILFLKIKIIFFLQALKVLFFFLILKRKIIN